MPYNFTHALVGLAAREHISPEIAARIDTNLDVFLIGTMGPDPYFGDAMPKPPFAPCHVDLAEKLHTLDMRVLFAVMLPLARGNDVLTAYALGFLCHFVLDTTAHPYIEARFPGKTHTPAEIQMDLMMADRVMRPGVPASPRRFYRTRHLAELDAFHTALIKTLFSLETEGVFRRSFRKWIAVNTLSFDPKNRKRRFFGALEQQFCAPGKITNFLVSRHPDPNDRLNNSHAVWNAPWEPKHSRTESFVDLFESACAEAPTLLRVAWVALETGEINEALLAIGARRMDARPV